MKNNFELKKFLIENKLTSNSLKEDQERDHQFYANKEGAEIIMQIAKDAINLMDEQPGTSPHIALQSVLEQYIEDNDLE
jgi:hypothetical protein